MQTGKVYLITDSMVIETIQMEGKIFPDGRGYDIISCLSQVYSEENFRHYINRIAVLYGKNSADSFLIKNSIDKFISNSIMDFTDRRYQYGQTIGVEWTYWKSITEKKIQIKVEDCRNIVLEQYETLALFMGKAVIYPKKTPIKTKDTLRPIELIEKTGF